MKKMYTFHNKNYIVLKYIVFAFILCHNVLNGGMMANTTTKKDTSAKSAVILLAGKQFKVSVGDAIDCEKLHVEAGETISIDKVLLLSEGESIEIGKPFVAGVSVKAHVVSHGRDKKIIVFKKNRRHVYQRKHGHRQQYTTLRITSI